VLLAGCGDAVGAAPNDFQQSQFAASTSSPSSSTATTWARYDDPTYGFSISYPVSMAFRRDGGVSGTDLLEVYRVVDPLYLNGYPPGQIELAIYKRDSDLLTSWIGAHSGRAGTTKLSRYWAPPSNVTPITVGGHTAVMFEWVPDIGDRTIHAVAFFSGKSYVLIVEWWSSVQLYASVLRPIHARMLNELKI
jgi:hypothetical protein